VQREIDHDPAGLASRLAGHHQAGDEGTQSTQHPGAAPDPFEKVGLQARGSSLVCGLPRPFRPVCPKPARQCCAGRSRAPRRRSCHAAAGRRPSEIFRMWPTGGQTSVRRPTSAYNSKEIKGLHIIVRRRTEQFHIPCRTRIACASGARPSASSASASTPAAIFVYA
jgi:hypothetical protein